ncbi:Non-ous end-joining factor 1 [Merluccius polli]|uniref:Non-ous end-joining factor 1 n=1 Tax=Merluccius polli TaxID=89951 RepID=A0AA47NPY5_MERPO|nr:Non-ous end-joining factor 1 [Merluccius polli]
MEERCQAAGEVLLEQPWLPVCISGCQLLAKAWFEDTAYHILLTDMRCVWEETMHASAIQNRAQCEEAGMRISTSKSESMVLNRKRVECTLRVGDEILPQVEEFKYLGVLFTSEGRMEREIDRRIGAASAVMQTLHGSVVVKRELSRFTSRSTFLPSPMVMSFG